MKNDRYIEYIQIARKIVAEADLATLEYQVVAFEIVLKHLLDSDVPTPLFDSYVDAAVEKRLEDARESRKDRD